MPALVKLTIFAALMAIWPLAAFAQTSEVVPDELEGVEITEHLDEYIALDLSFKDETGQEVTLGKYFEGDKPVALTLIYFNCPMLCSLVVNGFVDGLRDLPLEPGKDFEMVTVSFNPLETPVLAKLKKQNYVKSYGKPGANQGWHFLTGDEENIKALTEAVGFGYKWNEERQEFAHQAAVFFLTPEGKLSRYLYGVQFEPKEVKLALLEASEGKIGTTVDKVVLYCYQYDPSSNTYAPIAINIMKLGGIAILIMLAIILTPLWLLEIRRKKQVMAGESGK